jgi:hypothetical protein
MHSYRTSRAHNHYVELITMDDLHGVRDVHSLCSNYARDEVCNYVEVSVQCWVYVMHA